MSSRKVVSLVLCAVLFCSACELPEYYANRLVPALSGEYGQMRGWLQHPAVTKTKSVDDPAEYLVAHWMIYATIGGMLANEKQLNAFVVCASEAILQATGHERELEIVAAVNEYRSRFDFAYMPDRHAEFMRSGEPLSAQERFLVTEAITPCYADDRSASWTSNDVGYACVNRLPIGDHRNMIRLSIQQTLFPDFQTKVAMINNLRGVCREELINQTAVVLRPRVELQTVAMPITEEQLDCLAAGSARLSVDNPEGYILGEDTPTKNQDAQTMFDDCVPNILA